LYASLLIYSTVTPCLLACVRHSRSGERLHVDTRNPSVDEIGDKTREKNVDLCRFKHYTILSITFRVKLFPCLY